MAQTRRRREAPLSVGTAFHPRTAPQNRKMQWREWSGYFAASVYADFHDIEYNAIREQAALIDVSPLYKYEVRGRDAERLVDRVITRDATKLRGRRRLLQPVVRRGRQGRRRRHDPPARRGSLPLDRGRSPVPLADAERVGARRRDRGRQRAVAAVALQGPWSRAVLEAAAGESFADLRYFRRRPATIAGDGHRRQPDRLHGRPRLRAVDPGRAARSTCGTPSSPPASRTASARPGWSPSTSSGSRPGSSSSRSTTRAPATP